MKNGTKLPQIGIIKYDACRYWSHYQLKMIFGAFECMMIGNFFDFFGTKTYFAFYVVWTPEQKETVYVPSNSRWSMITLENTLSLFAAPLCCHLCDMATTELASFENACLSKYLNELRFFFHSWLFDSKIESVHKTRRKLIDFKRLNIYQLHLWWIISGLWSIYEDVPKSHYR